MSRKGLAVILAASTLTVMAGTVLAPVIEVLRRDLALTTTAAGVVLTAHSLGLIVAGPYIGRASRRFGARGLMGGGLVVYGLAGAAGSVIGSYWVLLVSRVVFGFGVAAVFTATTVALLNQGDRPFGDRPMGWRTTAMSVGGIAWPFVGGVLGSIDWRLAFLSYLAALPLAALSLRWLPGEYPSPAIGRVEIAQTPTKAWLESGLVKVYLLQVLASIVLYAMLLLAPLRLAELSVHDPRWVALSPIGVSVGMSIGGIYYPRARRIHGVDRLLTYAYLLWGISLITAGAVTYPPLLFGAGAVLGFGMGLVIPTLTMLVGVQAPESSHDTAVATLGSVTFAGQLLSPLLLGPLAEKASMGIALGVTGAVAILAAVYALSGTDKARDDEIPG